MRLVVPFGVALLLLSSAAAQTSPQVTDPTGDVAVLGAAPGPADAVPASDLTALTLSASPTTLNLTIEVASLDAQRPYVDSSNYEAAFAFDGARYMVLVERVVPVAVTVPTSYQANLYVWDAGIDYWRQHLELEPILSANAVTVAIPLQELRDPTGLPVRNGSVLTDLVVHSEHGQDRIAGGATSTPLGPAPAGAPYLLRDRMPDTGFATYAVAIPVVGGAVLLDSPEPVRATNGGPGTFVYPVRATSASDDPVTVELVAQAPEGWGVAIVDAGMELAPGESRTTQAVVKPPFGHAHGMSTNITVNAVVDGEASDSQVVLQLLYSDPAQPAGHHPRLFLHATQPRDTLGFNAAYELATGFSVRTAYMNTLDEDPADLRQPVSGVGRDAGDQWRIPLSPGLGMGLDFDVQGSGRLTASFASSNALGIPDASFSGSIVLEASDGDLVLARAPATPPAAVPGPSPLAATAGTEVLLDFAMTPAADYVPYAADTNLVLLLHANYTEPGARIGYTSLNLLPGGWLQLPFMEYQDLVPLQQSGALSVTARPEQATGNPGDTVAFTLTLRNDGADAIPLAIERLEVSRASILEIGQASVRVPAHSSIEVPVLVAVPQEAIEGELFNAFIALRPGNDAASILVRLTTLVTTEQDIDPAQELARKQSPAAPWLAFVVLLGLAVRRRAGR